MMVGIAEVIVSPPGDDPDPLIEPVPLGVCAVFACATLAAVGILLALFSAPKVHARSERRLLAAIMAVALLYWAIAVMWSDYGNHFPQPWSALAGVVVIMVLPYLLPLVLVRHMLAMRWLRYATDGMHCEVCGYPRPSAIGPCPECGNEP